MSSASFTRVEACAPRTSRVSQHRAPYITQALATQAISEQYRVTSFSILQCAIIALSPPVVSFETREVHIRQQPLRTDRLGGIIVRFWSGLSWKI